MSDTFYKPLTPRFREEINASIDCNIAELKTCSNNAFVNAQIVGLKATRNLINNLPDGYPIPMERR